MQEMGGQGYVEANQSTKIPKYYQQFNPAVKRYLPSSLKHSMMLWHHASTPHIQSVEIALPATIWDIAAYSYRMSNGNRKHRHARLSTTPNSGNQCILNPLDVQQMTKIWPQGYSYLCTGLRFAVQYTHDCKIGIKTKNLKKGRHGLIRCPRNRIAA